MANKKVALFIVLGILIGAALTLIAQQQRQTGKAYWLDADPPGELHGDVNETAKPIEVMVIEQQK